MFLNGVLIASTTGAIGLNHRKNSVINFGLIGLLYLGTRVSDGFARYGLLNPYWGIPLCIIIGALVNIALNIWYISLLPRLQSWKKVSALSLIPFTILVLAGNYLSSYLSSIANSVLMGFLIKDFDFTLFTIPGVLVLGTALFLFSFILSIILSPVIDDGPRGFDKWDIAVYAISGISASLSGVFFPFWFTNSWSSLFILVLTGVFIGGLDKKINPSLGGLLIGFFYVLLKSPGYSDLWFSNQALTIVAAIGLLALYLYPYGLVGSFRKMVEHNY